MISNERKLFIFIGAKAFRTNNKEKLEKFVNKFVEGLNAEETEYALSLFKGIPSGNEVIRAEEGFSR